MWVRRQQTLSYFSESFSAGFVPLFSLIYISTTSHRWSDEEIVALLDEASDGHDAMGISGMLLYCDGVLLQVIEGSEESVRQFYSSVLIDDQHQGVVSLAEEYIPERNFPQFAMGYRRVTLDDLRAFDAAAMFDDVAQFVDYLQRTPEKALPLLLHFRPA